MVVEQEDKNSSTKNLFYHAVINPRTKFCALLSISIQQQSELHHCATHCLCNDSISKSKADEYPSTSGSQ